MLDFLESRFVISLTEYERGLVHWLHVLERLSIDGAIDSFYALLAPGLRIHWMGRPAPRRVLLALVAGGIGVVRRE